MNMDTLVEKHKFQSSEFCIKIETFFVSEFFVVVQITAVHVQYLCFLLLPGQTEVGI